MTVRSNITEPFNVTELFSEETYRNGTLYVPTGTKDLYIRFDGWREFLNIVEMGEEPAPGGQCATPTIIAMGNKMRFECDTPGAEFTSYLTTSEEFTGSEVEVSNKDIVFTLTVYATAPDYDRSQLATMKFVVKKTDVNGDGRVDVADIATIISEMAAQARMQEGTME